MIIHIIITIITSGAKQYAQSMSKLFLKFSCDDDDDEADSIRACDSSFQS